MPFISSVTPMSLATLPMKTGTMVPATIVLCRPREISASVSCSPDRYRSISASSLSAIASISICLSCSTSAL
jgi:hypothetical protein